MTTRILLRGGTAAEWTSENPTLAAREVGVETDTHKLKIGDGTSAWASLSYAVASDSTKQPLDTDLTAIAALTSAADKVAYATGAGTWALADFTAAGRALMDDAAATNQRTTLGLAIGTDVQAYDAELAAIAGLTSAADRLPYFTGSGTASLATFTAAGRALVDDADASAQRTTLGLGNLAAATTINEYFCIAIGDETTAITTGTAKVTFRMPFALTVTAVRASLTTASSSGIPTFNIKDSGTTILSTKLTIDANELTSTTAATAAVISDTALADDAQITIDVDVAGTGAAGAKIWIFGTRTV